MRVERLVAVLAEADPVVAVPVEGDRHGRVPISWSFRMTVAPSGRC